MGDNGTEMGLAGAGAGFFVGEYPYRLDPKRRLTIPAEWREIVGAPEKLFVIPSLSEQRPPHLRVFPARAMGPKLQNIHSMTQADEDAGDCLRIVGAMSQLTGWDTQGRIRIRESLLQHAGFVEVPKKDSDCDVMVVGTWHGFEIWRPDVWAKEKTKGMANKAALLKTTRKVGI